MRQRSIALITFNWSRLDVAAVGLAPGGTVLAEDVRDLQDRSNHDRRRYRAGGFSASRFACLWRGGLRRASGLSILAMSPVATRV